jgi:hypothetical protein
VISIFVYKLVHLFSIFLLMALIGGTSLHAANGGSKADNSAQRLVSSLHGLALLLILLTGFGMLARLGIQHNWIFPGWVWGKLIIWLAIGATAMLPYRKPQLAKLFLLLVPLLAAVAAGFALFKPF